MTICLIHERLSPAVRKYQDLYKALPGHQHNSFAIFTGMCLEYAEVVTITLCRAGPREKASRTSKHRQFTVSNRRNTGEVNQ